MLRRWNNWGQIDAERSATSCSAEPPFWAATSKCVITVVAADPSGRVSHLVEK
jgi:hypothetical protein